MLWSHGCHVMVTCSLCCAAVPSGATSGNSFAAALAPLSQQSQPLASTALSFFGEQSTASTQQAPSGGECLSYCVCVRASIHSSGPMPLPMGRFRKWTILKRWQSPLTE